MAIDVDIAWPSLAQRWNLDFVVLFGSQQRQRTRPDSDIDVAVMPDSEPAIADLLDVTTALMASLRRSDVDLTWLPQASWLLQWEVAQGQLLFERRPGLFSSWRSFAWSRYADARFWREHDRRFLDRYLKGDWSLNRDLVQRKLTSMVRYLTELESHLPQTEVDFERDPFAVERLLQLLVDAAVAVNTEVAESVAKIPASDYYSSFFSLERCGWLPAEVARDLAPMAGLRNRLDHQYEEVDTHLTYQRVVSSLTVWRTYLQSVQARLSAEE